MEPLLACLCGRSDPVFQERATGCQLLPAGGTIRHPDWPASSHTPYFQAFAFDIVILLLACESLVFLLLRLLSSPLRLRHLIFWCRLCPFDPLPCLCDHGPGPTTRATIPLVLRLLAAHPIRRLSLLRACWSSSTLLPGMVSPERRFIRNTTTYIRTCTPPQPGCVLIYHGRDFIAASHPAVPSNGCILALY